MNTAKELLAIEAGWFHVFHDFVRTKMAGMSSSDLRVYLAIRTHVNNKGDSFPSIDLIAKVAGLSEIQVKRAVKSLEDTGYIVKKRVGRHNVYQMLDQWPVVTADTRDEVSRFEITPYIPALVNEITQQLKTALASGNITINGPVNINMPVTINHINNGIINHGTIEKAEVVNIKLDDCLANLPESLRIPMLAMRPKPNCG
jgi:DNA-binding transcriptional regulator YhcF (GntR family)